MRVDHGGKDKRIITLYDPNKANFEDLTDMIIKRVMVVLHSELLNAELTSGHPDLGVIYPGIGDNHESTEFIASKWKIPMPVYLKFSRGAHSRDGVNAFTMHYGKRFDFLMPSHIHPIVFTWEGSLNVVGFNKIKFTLEDLRPYEI